jgi:hypothetical protein
MHRGYYQDHGLAVQPLFPLAAVVGVRQFEKKALERLKDDEAAGGELAEAAMVE